MWLRDFLPEHTPTARILTYGYDSRLLKNDSTASIKEFSRNLLESLNTARARDEVIISFNHDGIELIIGSGKASANHIHRA